MWLRNKNIVHIEMREPVEQKEVLLKIKIVTEYLNILKLLHLKKGDYKQFKCTEYQLIK
jgi:flagellar motor switch protein FliM